MVQVSLVSLTILLANAVLQKDNSVEAIARARLLSVERYLRLVQGSVAIRNVTGSEVLIDSRYTVKRNGQCILLREDDQLAKTTSIRGVNPQYEFLLEGPIDGPLRVKEVIPRSKPGPPPDWIWWRYLPCLGGYYVGKVSWAERLDQGRVTATLDPDGALVLCTKDESRLQNQLAVTYRTRFSPITKLPETTRVDHELVQGSMTEEYAYSYSSTDPESLKKCVLRTQSRINGKESAAEESGEFDLQVPSTEPADAEFTLSAFGFIEPFGSPYKPTPWFLYAGIGAGVIFLLAILLGVWQKRLARGAA